MSSPGCCKLHRQFCTASWSHNWEAHNTHLAGCPASQPLWFPTLRHACYLQMAYDKNRRLQEECTNLRSNHELYIKKIYSRRSALLPGRFIRIFVFGTAFCSPISNVKISLPPSLFTCGETERSISPQLSSSFFYLKFCKLACKLGLWLPLPMLPSIPWSPILTPPWACGPLCLLAMQQSQICRMFN